MIRLVHFPYIPHRKDNSGASRCSSYIWLYQIYECDSIRNVTCYSLYTLSRIYEVKDDLYLTYPGGPLSDLPEEVRVSAARGYIAAMEQGIAEIGSWREEYPE